MMFKPLAAFALTALACLPAMAQEANRRPSEIWLATGFATYHFESDVE